VGQLKSASTVQNETESRDGELADKVLTIFPFQHKTEQQSFRQRNKNIQKLTQGQIGAPNTDNTERVEDLMLPEWTMSPVGAREKAGSFQISLCPCVSSEIHFPSLLISLFHVICLSSIPPFLYFTLYFILFHFI
jgi:hypothetical protein